MSSSQHLDPIQHAIVGCGRIAPSHADAFARAEGAALYACCDPCPDRARGLAEKFSIPHVHHDFTQLLEDPVLHSVSLCVPHYLHGPMTEQALAAGKHVLVEKPFALESEQARAVAQSCRASGLIVQPVCQHRFDFVVGCAREIVAQDLGRLCMVRAHLECRRPPEYYSQSDWRGRWPTEGGSVLINQAYHVVDLMLWLAGPIQQAAASMATLTGQGIMETEDALSANLTFASGALGGLTVNGASGAQWHSYIELCGSGGVLAFDIGYPNQVPRLQLESRRSLQKWRKAFAQHFQSSPLPTAGLDYYGDSHRHEAAEFVQRIQGGPATVSCSLEQAESVVQAIDALYRSAKAGGRPVRLADSEATSPDLTGGSLARA